MKNRFTDEPVLFALALSISIALYAQGNVAHAQGVETDELEEIVVRGIRGSLAAAREIKRDAPVFVDSIVAEDIGKFPDENVAESLQRVPGVSINRASLGAEGNSVSIRGLGPDFNRVFVNGRSVLNSGVSRQVDFRFLPSEIVSRLDVYKTPMASLIEGAIGGTVEIKTASPFDNGGEFRASGSVETVFNSLADEWKPRLSGVVSNTFGDGKFGAMLGFQYQDRINRQDTFDVPGWQCVDETLESQCTQTLEELPAEDRFFRPRFPRQFLLNLDSERLGINGALHWRPTDNVKFEVDAVYSSIDDVEDQRTLIIGTFAGISQIVPGSAVINENNTITELSVTNADLRSANRVLDTENDTYVLGFNGELVSDLWTFTADLGLSKGTSDQDHDQAQIFREVDGTWNYNTSSGIPDFTIDGDFGANPETQDGWLVNNVRKEVSFREQDETNLRLDITRAFDAGFLQSVQFGARYTDGGVEQNAYGRFLNVRPRPLIDDNFNPADVLTTIAGATGISDYGTDLPGNIIANWTNAPFQPIRDFFLPDDPLSTTNFPNTYTIEEETIAAYVQANFSGDMGRFPISGNIGVRYVETDVETTGGANFDFLNLQTGSYDDVLPSLNLRVDLADELLLRFAAGSVMARPSYGDLNPGTVVNVTTFSGRSGNPNLLPFRADQIDISLEWYFGGGNLLGLTYFYKDVESFVQTETIFTTIDPILAAGVDPDSIFAIARPGNGEGATINGLELTYQQSFDMLPAPFDGLGMMFNYTRLDSDAQQTNSLIGVEVGLEGLSENAYNITAYYEKNGIGVRLAYNWRDEFLRAAQGLGGTPDFGNEYGQLDLTTSYDVSDRVTLFVEAKNLNNEEYRAFEFLDERLRTYNTSGRRVFLGARARFD